MKRGAIDHPKTQMLAALLDVRKCVAVGIRECMQSWASEFAPDGNIARWPEHVFARAIDWPVEDIGRVIDALCDSELLDRLDDGALYIHDFHEHAEHSVQIALARAGRRFANGAIPIMTKLAKEERAPLEARYAEEEKRLEDGLAQEQKDNCAEVKDDAKPVCADSSTSEGTAEADTEADTEAEALANAYTNADTDTETRARGPAQERNRPSDDAVAVGDTLGSALGVLQSGDSNYLDTWADDLNRRIKLVTPRDGPGWRRKWPNVVAAFRRAGALSALDEIVRYAEDCANPATRRAKDMGVLENPGGYIWRQCQEAAKEHGIELPSTGHGKRKSA